MAAQCVKFETEAGVIEMEMYPESAPESVRGFLNLAATGSLDTTTFSRVVPGFVIQGGDLFTREKMTAEIDKRARRTLPRRAESQIKHERGVISMARGDEPNSASTHFFILLREARTLDGKFAAFGRVTSGMETVEAINKMPVEGEKPTKPVRITRAAVAPCAAPIKLKINFSMREMTSFILTMALHKNTICRFNDRRLFTVGYSLFVVFNGFPVFQ
jgi:peptidyl-prolyl cis-trans isomerase B (cyclophilin B)